MALEREKGDLAMTRCGKGMTKAGTRPGTNRCRVSPALSKGEEVLLSEMKLALLEVRQGKLTTDRGSLRIAEAPWYSSQVYPLGNVLVSTLIVLAAWFFVSEFFLGNNGSAIRVIFEQHDLNFLENQRLLIRGRYVEDRSRATVLATVALPASARESP